MSKIFFKDSNGQKVYVTVSDETANEIKEIRRAEWRSDAKANYHNISLHALEESGYQIADDSPDPLESIIQREERADKHRRLKQALSTLTPSQKQLANLLYVKRLSVTEIAEKFGTTYQAIQNRRNKILEKLKKVFV